MSKKTILVMFVIMFLWSLCYPLITVGIQFSPHLTFAAMRASIAGLTLLILAWADGHLMPQSKQNWTMFLLIGLGSTSLGYFGMFHASEFISPGTATVINNTQPLMAAVLANLFLREKISRFARLGLIAGFVGILLISFPALVQNKNNNGFYLGITYITLAAFGISISNVLIKNLAKSVNALQAIGWQLLLGSIPLWTMALLWEEPLQVQWTRAFIFSLIGLSIFGSSLVYWLWFKVLKTNQLTHVNVFTFLVPIFGLSMGAIFFNESIGIWTITGSLLTIFGVFLVQKS